MDDSKSDVQTKSGSEAPEPKRIFSHITSKVVDAQNHFRAPSTNESASNSQVLGVCS
jgi:hypothetical protein